LCIDTHPEVFLKKMEHMPHILTPNNSFLIRLIIIIPKELRCLNLFIGVYIL
jgi:hypothetical protein